MAITLNPDNQSNLKQTAVGGLAGVGFTPLNQLELLTPGCCTQVLDIAQLKVLVYISYNSTCAHK
jgi:hypothetical protein